MARVRGIVRYQWLAYWRMLRGQGGLRNANVGITLAVGGIFLLANGALCFMAVRLLQDGRGTVGNVAIETAMLNVVGGWLILPVIVAGLQSRGGGVTAARLLRFPLSYRELYVLGITAALIQPVYWLLGLASLVTLLPFLWTPRPVAGLAAGGLLFLAAAFSSWAISLAGEATFTSPRWRKIAMICLLVAYSAALFGDDLVEFETTEDGLFAAASGYRVLLLGPGGDSGVLVSFRDFLPGAWVTKASAGSQPLLWIGALATATVLAVTVGFVCLRRLVRTPPTTAHGSRSTRAVKTPGFVHGPVGFFVAKEIRYYSRTLDQLLGIITSVAVTGYLLVDEDPSVVAPLIGAWLIVGFQQALAFNAFGLDLDGIDRYRLAPVTGASVLASKQLAYGFTLWLQGLPLWLVTAWRWGVLWGLGGAIGLAACLVFLATLGVRTSIHAPVPRSFFELVRAEQQGGFVAAFVSIATLLTGFSIAMLSARMGNWAVPLGQLALLAAALAYNRRTLPELGIAFERSRETMGHRLRP